MANLYFQQPCLNWNAQDLYQEYTRFVQHVRFTFLGPLAATDKQQKAGWVGMWIGQQGREIYKTLHLTQEEEADPDIILKKIEDYVRPRQNKRVNRFRAQQRKQIEGESFDNFIKDLKLLIMDCEYDNPDDLLVDLIINGVLHKKVQERLLDQGQKLTLSKAIEIGQQYELSQSQIKMMRGEEVLAMRNEPKSRSTHNKKNQETGFKKSFRSSSSKLCGKCGRNHEKGTCPAFGTTCKFCKKKNHWMKVCRKRRDINLVDDDSQSDNDILPINIAKEQHANRRIENVNIIEDKWTANIVINNKVVNFRVDTGAKCNILVKSEFEKIKGKNKLSHSTKSLKSYTNHVIKTLGAVVLPLKYKNQEIKARFEVVDICQENILSGDTAECLGLLQRIDSIKSNSEDELLRDFPEMRKTTGTLPGEYKIQLEENAKGVIHPPRRLAASLRKKVVEKLKEMQSDGFITPVHEPTEWVSSMVVSFRNDKVRICIDPKDLNKAIKREHHPMKTIEDVITNIPGSKVFSVLDAKSGFMQIKLQRESSFLTTFNTPLGRYRWLRLPYGIKSAPEIYQRIMDEMLQGIKGPSVIIDDILIAGRDSKHHDLILKQVMQRATEYNLKLNYDKCKIRQNQVPYMGHILSEKGLEPDPAKLKAIIEMPAPIDKDGMRRFLGLIQYLAKFIPNLSHTDSPLRNLLKTDVEFQWNHEQEKSFQELKRLCAHPPVLAYYDVNKDVQIECDASKDGLGAVLLQDGRVIAYASRALTDAEKRYAQLEKEMLSIVYSTNKFHCFIFGKEVTVFNDHKPLEQIFKKSLLSAPMRIQKMLMRLQWYDLKVCYRKGKEMFISDALSRAYLPNTEQNCEFTDDSVKMISVSETKYTEIQDYTHKELSMLSQVIMKGWPDTRNETPIEVRAYWDSRDQLSTSDGIIYKGLRIVIPPSLRSDMLKLIHKSHLGIVKCKQRAREVMFWPRMNADIENTVRDCGICAEHQNQQVSEPLVPTKTPDLPYSMVGCDLFELERKKYVLLVDYYSKFIDVVELRHEATSAVVEAMKSVFACHGIPKRLRSDNGPQFTSAEFKNFCKQYGIEHETSSPHFQSSNGEAERAIQTVKKLWKKSKDKFLALLDYRTTPLADINLSPAQLLMGRRPRNLLPSSKEILLPKAPDPRIVKRHFDSDKQSQKHYYDNRKGVKDHHPLQDGTLVRMRHGTKWKPGIVTSRYHKPRSYVVSSGDQIYRRNRKHIRVSSEKANRSYSDDDLPDIPYDSDDNTPIPLSPRRRATSDNTMPLPRMASSGVPTTRDNTEPPPHMAPPFTATSREPYTTRSGRVVNKPKRLDL